MALPRKQKRDAFIAAVRSHYRDTGRHDLPWRITHDPYHILVSEIMLQQTQVERVRGFYTRFLKAFPTITDLGQASPAQVITAWQGLGYNRRALALHRAAQVITTQYQGTIPRTYEELVALPGIGPYTAGAVRAFTWNEPGVFLETNLRAAYIHYFFPTQELVSDKELMPIVEATIDNEHPREWYWALMDYGAHIKATIGNATRKSKTYAKQSTFAGSDRQLRGRILRMLINNQHSLADMHEITGENKERLERILNALITEGFLVYAQEHYALAS